MTDEALKTNEKESDSKQKRAVGVFPRLPLKKTLELAEAIFELGEGESVSRLTVFHKLNRSPDSGSSRTLVTASNSYALTTGGYQANYLGITDTGKKIVDSDSELNRYEAIYSVLFSNEIFSSFVSRFSQKGVPIDEVAIRFLKEAYKLVDADAKACWSVIKDNLWDYNLVQEFSGKKVIVSREMALEPLQKFGAKQVEEIIKPLDEVFEDDAESASSHLSRQTLPNFEKISSQFHFNIQIQIPDNASAETYDNIFKSIATHLLGRN